MSRGTPSTAGQLASAAGGSSLPREETPLRVPCDAVSVADSLNDAVSIAAESKCDVATVRAVLSYGVTADTARRVIHLAALTGVNPLDIMVRVTPPD